MTITCTIGLILVLSGLSSARLANFFAVDTLADGEAERRFHFNGTAAKETVAVYTSSHGSREGAILRQMTDGRHLIQLIYDADENLQDCQYVTDADMRLQFMDAFSREYQQMSGRIPAGLQFHNVTMRDIQQVEDLPDDLSSLFNYRLLRKKCRQVHRRILKESLAKQSGQGQRTKRDMMMMPGTRWCGDGHRASKFSDLGAQQSVDRCCRRHDHCPYTIRSKHTNYELTNKRLITISHCDCDERRRRDATDLLRVPHTKWCGPGNRAAHHRELGGFAAADRCCRQHDERCPYYIDAWQEKYLLYNERPYTAMHCTCDERFRSCLKQANTAASNFVGKLFFNIIQTKCFVLKPEKVCKKSTWWGACQQTEWKKKAHLRDPIVY